jgi:hypothetical protein
LSGDSTHLYAGTIGGGMFRLDLNGQPPAGGATVPSSASPTPVEEAHEPAAAQPEARASPLGLYLGLGAGVIVLAALAVLFLRRGRVH